MAAPKVRVQHIIKVMVNCVILLAVPLAQLAMLLVIFKLDGLCLLSHYKAMMLVNVSTDTQRPVEGSLRKVVEFRDDVL